MARPPRRSEEDLRRQANEQARDSKGRWVEMGRPVKSVVNGKTYSGSLVGVKGGYAYILPHVGPIRKENATHSPQPEPEMYRVPLKNTTKVDAKGKLPSQKERDRISTAKARFEAEELNEQERRESEEALREIQEDLKDKIRERAEREDAETEKKAEKRKEESRAPQGEQDTLFDVPETTQTEDPKPKPKPKAPKKSETRTTEPLDIPEPPEQDTTPDPAPDRDGDSDEAMFISEDDLKGAIKDAKDSGDMDKFHRLTDLDQFGNRHWNRTNDKLLPGEGVKKLEGRTLEKWLANASDEEKADAEDKFLYRAANEVVKGEDGLENNARLSDLDGTLKRLNRYVTQLSAVNPNNKALSDMKDMQEKLEKSVADERAFRKNRAEARAMAFEANRAEKLKRLKDVHEDMEDGSLKRALGQAISDVEMEIQQNDGSLRGQAVGSALEEAVRKSGVKNARKVRQGLSKAITPDIDRPTRVQIPSDRRKRYEDYSKRVVDRHPLARPTQRSLYNGETLVQRDLETDKIIHALKPGDIVLWDKKGRGKPEQRPDGTWIIVPDPQPVRFIGSDNSDGREQGRGQVKVEFLPETQFKAWEISADKKQVHLRFEENLETKKEAARTSVRGGKKEFGYAVPRNLYSTETGEAFDNTTINMSANVRSRSQTNSSVRYVTADGQEIERGMDIRFTMSLKKDEGKEYTGRIVNTNFSNGTMKTMVLDSKTLEPLENERGDFIYRNPPVRQMVSREYQGPAPTIYSYGIKEAKGRYAPEPPKLFGNLRRDEKTGFAYYATDEEQERLDRIRDTQWGPNDAPLPEPNAKKPAPTEEETKIDNPIASGGEETSDSELAKPYVPEDGEDEDEPTTPSAPTIDPREAANRLLNRYNAYVEKAPNRNPARHGAGFVNDAAGRSRFVARNPELFEKYLQSVERSPEGQPYSKGVELLRNNLNGNKSNELTPKDAENERNKAKKDILDEILRKGLGKVVDGRLTLDDLDAVEEILKTTRKNANANLRDSVPKRDQKIATIVLGVVAKIQNDIDLERKRQERLEEANRARTPKRDDEDTAPNPNADDRDPEGPTEDDLKDIEDEG